MQESPYDICCDECRDPISCLGFDRPEGRCALTREMIADRAILVHAWRSPMAKKRHLIQPLADMARAAGWKIDDKGNGIFHFTPPESVT